MRLPESKDRTSVAVAIVKSVNQSERTLLRAWLEALLKIRSSDLTTVQKTRQAVRVTLESKAIWPIMKLLATQAKKHGWDDRSSRTRWAAVASAVGLTLFGGQSAGIAALGGAIGVPLWVVFGGGAALAKVLLDEMQRSQVSAAHGAERPIDDELSDFIDAEYFDLTSDLEKGTEPTGSRTPGAASATKKSTG